MNKNSPQERPGKPDGVRAQNRQAKMRTISEACLELFLKTGIEAVTIDQIVSEAGMAKGTFYRYFQDKEAAVEFLLKDIAEKVDEALVQCLNEVDNAKSRDALLGAYQSLAQKLAVILYGAPKVGRLYLQESRGPDRGAIRPIAKLSRLILDRSIELTKVAQKHGLQRAVQHEVSARAVVGAVEALILASLDGSLTVPPSKTWSTLISLVVDGLKAER